MNLTNNISQTAMLVASLRALACYEEDPLIRGSDYLAELFLPEDKRLPLKASDYRPMIKNAIPEGLYEYVIARTKYFDKLFLDYLDQQIPQIILLGAGYDSRAYRYANHIKNTIIYEVDTSATQKMKRQILKDNNVIIHSNVRYISADFEQNGWFQRLYDSGYQSSLLTLFIWEGVTFYLTPKSVNSTLSLLTQHSLNGSILSFDFQHRDKDCALIDTGLREEIIQFGLNVQECESYLQQFGYSMIERLDTETMSNRFLTMANGNKFGKLKSIMNIVTAQVNQ